MEQKINKKKIVYFGENTDYSSELKDELLKISEDVEFIQEEQLIVPMAIEASYGLECDVLIIDFINKKTDMRNLRRSLEGVVKSVKHFIALISEERVPEYVKTNHGSGEFIYFYKGVEYTDIVNYVSWMLYSHPVDSDKYLVAYYRDNLEFKQLMKVRSISRDSAILESDFNLEVDKNHVLTPSFSKDFFHSHMHHLKKVKKKISSFYFKNIYELEFKYFLKPLKRANAQAVLNQYSYDSSDATVSHSFMKDWLDIEKKQKNVLLVRNSSIVDEEIEEEDDTEFIKPDKKYEFMARSVFHDWVYKNTSLLSFKTEVVVVYSKNPNTPSKFKDFKYNLYFRSEIKDCDTEVSTDFPSVIVFDWNDFESLDQIKEYTSCFIKHKNFFPYILLCNYNGLGFRELQHYLEYHFVIQSPGDITQDFIDKILILYKKKKIEAEENRATKRLKKITVSENEKVFPKYIFDHEVIIDFDDEFGNIEMKQEFKITSMTEFDITFISTRQLEIGSIFWVENPFPFQVVVVPHREESKESKIDNCYRGVIHYINESRKMALRRFINKVYQMNGSNDRELTENELKELKRTFLVMGVQAQRTALTNK